MQEHSKEKELQSDITPEGRKFAMEIAQVLKKYGLEMLLPDEKTGLDRIATQALRNPPRNFEYNMSSEVIHNFLREFYKVFPDDFFRNLDPTKPQEYKAEYIKRRQEMKAYFQMKQKERKEEMYNL